MNHTTNYQLNQWDATDRVQRVDFNADNAKIDAAIKAAEQHTDQVAATIPKMHIGSYTGTGTFGAGHPNVLTFPFPPKLVIIVEDAELATVSGNVFIRGQTASAGVGTNISAGSYQCQNLTWSGNTLSWYTTAEWAYYQLNQQGINYRYFAIG